MVDSVSFPVTGGYAPVGIQPAESAPAPSSPAPAADQTQVRPAAAPAAAAAGAPSLVLDFSQGLSAAYVLDWRDPETDQVLVQIPMRTAFQQFTPAATSSQVGKHVDTAA